MGIVGKRCEVRLTSRCNSGCEHCTIAPLRGEADLSLDQAWGQIAVGHQAGCDELRFLKGEATLVKPLVKLVRRARTVGYTRVTLETNARMLAYDTYVAKLLDAGVTDFAVAFFGPDAARHDLVDGTEGAYAQAAAGLANLVRAGADITAEVPIVRRTFAILPEIVTHLHALGVRKVRLELSRPVQVGPKWLYGHVVRLETAGLFIREALARAAGLGMQAATRAVPLCHLDPPTSEAPPGWEDISGPLAPGCTGCPLVAGCPRTWEVYQRLYGTWELKPPVRPGAAAA